MTQLHFVWLGAKRARKLGVAEKGWRLDMAARAGLPVPNGGILLDEFYQLAMQERILVAENHQLHTPNPQALYDLLYTAVRFPQLDKPCAIRPLFARTVAPIPPCLNVPVTNAQALADVLCGLWTAALPASEETRHDVLIQEMVDGEVEGTAVSPPTSQTDTITINGQTMELSRPGLWQRPEPGTPVYLSRLQKLLWGIRHTFGKGAWRVDWVDDGRICWLLQIIEHEK
jgi:hypothetical protein